MISSISRSAVVELNEVCALNVSKVVKVFDDNVIFVGAVVMAFSVLQMLSLVLLMLSSKLLGCHQF